MTSSTRTFVPASPKFALVAPEAPASCDALNLEQAAQFLGISKKVLKKGFDAGSVPGVKIGRRYLFSKTALVDWVAGSARN